MPTSPVNRLTSRKNFITTHQVAIENPNIWVETSVYFMESNGGTVQTVKEALIAGREKGSGQEAKSPKQNKLNINTKAILFTCKKLW